MKSSINQYNYEKSRLKYVNNRYNPFQNKTDISSKISKISNRFITANYNILYNSVIITALATMTTELTYITHSTTISVEIFVKNTLDI